MFYLSTTKPEDWRTKLAKPETQWRDGFSAKELADAWQGANGFPSIIKNNLLNSSLVKNDIKFIQGIPEYKVDLPGGKRASQTDLFVLARFDDENVVIMVEGKHSESFGELISKWKISNSTNKIMSTGKEERLAFLLKYLNITEDGIDNLRYQLFHRTVSAMLAAERYGTKKAIMMVHTFSANNESYDDFEAFAKKLGFIPMKQGFTKYKKIGNINLSLGWINNYGIGEKEI